MSKKTEWLKFVREVTAPLENCSERLSHGTPSWFFKKSKCFASLADNHHGDGRLALWLCATLDAQQLLVNAEPKHFFVPAYVGHLGWVGVRLDKGIGKKKVKALVEQAWRVRAGLAGAVGLK